MRHSDLEPLPTDLAFELTNHDEWDHGSARFFTQVEVTTNLPAQLPEQTLCRLASYYILSRLTESNLKQACEALIDIFKWQSEQANISAAEPQKVVVKKAPKVRYVERRPFEISP
jgi:hypothetical protein